MSGHEEPGKAAELNSDLAISLTHMGKEPQVSIQHVDMARLEGILAWMREAQDFLLLVLGIFYHLLQSTSPPPNPLAMADQLLKYLPNQGMCRQSPAVDQGLVQPVPQHGLACVVGTYGILDSPSARRV